MKPAGPTPAGIVQRSNVLADRSLSCRLVRFLRARLRQLGGHCVTFADDPRVWRAWFRRWEAEHYVRLLQWRDAGFSPQVVYDIGGHRGTWSEMCEAVYRPREIILFEPQAAHHSEIKSRGHRARGNWRIMPFALGDADARLAMHLNEQSAASSLLPPQAGVPAEYWGGREVRTEEVPVVPLDALVKSADLPAPDLVKMDVQGFEAKVMAGGADTLRRASFLTIEVSLRPIYAGQVLLPEIVETVAGWGFVLEDATEALRRWPVGGLWQMDLWFRKSGAASSR